MRIAVDVMGGDLAPDAILAGCFDAAAELDADDSILLVGHQQAIQPAVRSSGLSAGHCRRLETVPATQTVAMGELPVEAIRNKPDSSINVMCRLAAEGRADAVLSAGNTGAFVAAAQLRMRTLSGVVRPGIAVVLPTFYGPVVICDVGANIAPQPRHLQQYALMAGAYAEAVCGVSGPRVGLLSFGEEEVKGTATIKEAHRLMRDEPQINFIGNIEGRDLLTGAADVAVCDGFVGNVVLKFTEGVTQGLLQMMQAEIESHDAGLGRQTRPVVEQMSARHDWRHYGGAPLLGIGGYALICHGRSDRLAIRNAIQSAKRLCASGVNDRIVEKLAASI